MNLLKDILYKTSITEVIGVTNITVTHVCFNSATVKAGSLFVAIRGTRVDGHSFIEKAITAGAIAIVCEEIPEVRNEKVVYIKVKNAAAALGYIASNFYDNPSEKIEVIGVTGTNGKTTTVTLLFKLFRQLGNAVGLLSTVANQINEEIIPASHTTPDPLTLNRLLSEMVSAGCKYCFMEVSSHAVDQHRITGLKFKGGIFTNITHDHLDYHKTFDAYIKAKKGFFDILPEDAFALVNNDDRNAQVMLQNTKAIKKSFALKSDADFKCRILENNFSGLLLSINGKEVLTQLIGNFNAYNLLGVYATAILLGVDEWDTLSAISSLKAPEGRFEYLVSTELITGIVDYAHTPDALENVLKTIENIRTHNEKVITVVGCGGDRDAAKRPVMARIACEMSDKVILTSDNPRTENPENILKQMQEGVPPVHFKKTLSITDRNQAIRTACQLASKGDIILVAGKGHEKYQEINGVKFPFDDFEILKKTLLG